MWTRKENMFREKVVQYGGAPSCEAKSAEKVVLYDGYYLSSRHGDYSRDAVEKLGNNNPTKGHRLRVYSQPSVIQALQALR